MGFKAVELSPIGTNGPTSTTPPGKDVMVKAFRVARTDTSATLKAVLPFQASIIDIHILGTASDAGTTATVSIGTSTTSTELVNAQDVKTAGGMIRPTTTMSATNIPSPDGLPITGDIQIYAKYAETGTASADGAWIVFVYYVN